MKIQLMCLVVVLSSCKNVIKENVEYYESGNVKQIETLKNSKRHGTFKSFYENGKVNVLSEWNDGKRNGMFLQYYADGMVYVKSKYVNDEIIDTFFIYYESGVVKEMTIAKYNLIQGFYPTGKLYYEGPQKTNIDAVGVFRFFYPNGEIKQVKHLISGKLTGEFRIFYPDGTLKELSYYKNDLKVGESILYDSLGRIKQKQYFENGEMVDYTPVIEYE